MSKDFIDKEKLDLSGMWFLLCCAVGYKDENLAELIEFAAEKTIIKMLKTKILTAQEVKKSMSNYFESQYFNNIYKSHNFISYKKRINNLVDSIIEDYTLSVIAEKIAVKSTSKISHDDVWSLYDEELAKDEQREFEENLRNGIAGEDMRDYENNN